LFSQARISNVDFRLNYFLNILYPCLSIWIFVYTNFLKNKRMPKKELLDLEYGRSKNVQIIHFRKKANRNA